MFELLGDYINKKTKKICNAISSKDKENRIHDKDIYYHLLKCIYFVQSITVN